MEVGNCALKIERNENEKLRNISDMKNKQEIARAEGRKQIDGPCKKKTTDK